jgi:hypothetical protein
MRGLSLQATPKWASESRRQHKDVWRQAQPGYEACGRFGMALAPVRAIRALAAAQKRGRAVPHNLRIERLYLSPTGMLG